MQTKGKSVHILPEYKKTPGTKSTSIEQPI